MRLSEIIREGAVKRDLINRIEDKLDLQRPNSTYIPPKNIPPIEQIQKTWYIDINGKEWGRFKTKEDAMQSANTLHQRKPYLRLTIKSKS